MRATTEELEQPVTRMVYRTGFGRRLASAVYLFDQEAARQKFRYYIDYCHGTLNGWGRWGYRLEIVISKRDEAKVKAAIENLQPKPEPEYRWWSIGNWERVGLPGMKWNQYNSCDWLFAVYTECGSYRTDGLNYIAVLFRNRGKTIFGIQESLGEEIPSWRSPCWKELAQRVVDDEAFRASLISDDPDLPAMWRRRFSRG